VSCNLVDNLYQYAEHENAVSILLMVYILVTTKLMLADG